MMETVIVERCKKISILYCMRVSNELRTVGVYGAEEICVAQLYCTKMTRFTAQIFPLLYTALKIRLNPFVCRKTLPVPIQKLLPPL
jgi:hypothetical protein